MKRAGTTSTNVTTPRTRPQTLTLAQHGARAASLINRFPLGRQVSFDDAKRLSPGAQRVLEALLHLSNAVKAQLANAGHPDGLHEATPPLFASQVSARLAEIERRAKKSPSALLLEASKRPGLNDGAAAALVDTARLLSAPLEANGDFASLRQLELNGPGPAHR